MNQNDDGHKEREMRIGLTVLTDFRHLFDWQEEESSDLSRKLSGSVVAEFWETEDPEIAEWS